MAIYTQKTSKGQLLSVSVVALASGKYKVEVRGIEPFYEADNSFQDQASATKHAQAMLDEYGWRLEEMYERDAQAAAQPLDVDMGGDFEGFVEAVNQPQPAQAQVWHTEPINVSGGSIAFCRITENANGYYVEMVIDGFIKDTAQVRGYRSALEIADEMIGNEKEPPAINRKHERMEEIRRALARLDRERESLAFELSQLQGD